jgi:acetyltransferase-like isoleucine patch superfamily enzyme
VWIGEAAVVMADIGRSSTVAAGAVVSSCVPPGIVVAGNPARFVRFHAPQAADSANAAI